MKNDAQRDGMTVRGMTSVMFLCVASLVFAGCAVAPPAATNLKPETNSGPKSSVGHFGGIGMKLGTKAGRLIVDSTINNSPAFHAGLLPGDIIIEINGEETMTMTLSEAVNKVRGEVGTTVKLKSARPSTQEVKEYSIARVDIMYALPQPGRQDSSNALPTTLTPPAEQAAPF
jgi:predicted metalloprotease with PDZ domain